MSSESSLPPAAVALAGRMYDAARAGQVDIFEQALPAGLPANMTNEKGDSLVSVISYSLIPHLLVFLPTFLIYRLETYIYVQPDFSNI